MTPGDTYLLQILQKYSPHDLSPFNSLIIDLRSRLQAWANTCYIEIINSGSRAKGTAISLASDVDYLVSLTNSCNENSGGLKSIYESLFTTLHQQNQNVRKQNVSIRVNIGGLQVDVTPARKQIGNTNDHSLYLSKVGTWRQTNVQRHITDISQSARLNEIKLLKIWREIHKLEFPSIYLEYLVIDNVLLGKAKGNDYLANNTFYTLQELAKDVSNPLYSRIIDPANSTNILSDLLTNTEKDQIIREAKKSTAQTQWGQIVW